MCTPRSRQIICHKPAGVESRTVHYPGTDPVCYFDCSQVESHAFGLTLQVVPKTKYDGMCGDGYTRSR